MTAQHAEELVRQAMRQVFRLEEVPDDASPETVAEWDSLNHINLMLELEGTLGISIPAPEYAELVSFRAILEAVRARLGADQ